jgi:hypothetical protein
MTKLSERPRYCNANVGRFSVCSFHDGVDDLRPTTFARATQPANGCRPNLLIAVAT